MKLVLKSDPREGDDAGGRFAEQLAPLRARWRTLAPRERRIVTIAAWAIGLAVVWGVLLAPAIRSLRASRTALESMDAQWGRMQALAGESRRLRNTAPVSREVAEAALKSATQRLGTGARLSMQGDRAVVQLTGVPGPALGAWLAEIRTGARARPSEASLARNGQVYNGTVTLTLPGSR